MAYSIKNELILKRFPFLEEHFSFLQKVKKVDYGYDDETLDQYFDTVFVEYDKSIFLSESCPDCHICNRIFLYDINKNLLLTNDSRKTVERNVLDLLNVGEKVYYIVRRTKHRVYLYLLPEGVDSVADIMIPMLAPVYQTEEDKLEKKIGKLYKKEEQPVDNLVSVPEKTKKSWSWKSLFFG